MKVLVLGATGMLGSMVYDYLSRKTDFEVLGTSRKKQDEFIFFDVYSHDKKVFEKVDYVVNCIGITKPFCHDDNFREIKNAIWINGYFPHILSDYAKEYDFKIIQIATDCVYSGKDGGYKESSLHDALDVYGKTKSLGEVKRDELLNIRCSIIGPERYKKAFLLEWFLSNKKGNEVNGFSTHLWNGVTTLQFAKICAKIIKEDLFDCLVRDLNIHHFVPNSTVNKYELLSIFNDVFFSGLKINKVDKGICVLDRTLSTERKMLADVFGDHLMKDAMSELKEYIEETNFYEKK